MSPKRNPKARKLVLGRETIRTLEDLAATKFGPQTSERVACCGETIDVNGQPITW